MEVLQLTANRICKKKYARTTNSRLRLDVELSNDTCLSVGVERAIEIHWVSNG